MSGGACCRRGGNGAVVHTGSEHGEGARVARRPVQLPTSPDPAALPGLDPSPCGSAGLLTRRDWRSAGRHRPSG